MNVLHVVLTLGFAVFCRRSEAAAPVLDHYCGRFPRVSNFARMRGFHVWRRWYSAASLDTCRIVRCHCARCRGVAAVLSAVICKALLCRGLVLPALSLLRSRSPHVSCCTRGRYYVCRVGGLGAGYWIRKRHMDHHNAQVRQGTCLEGVFVFPDGQVRTALKAQAALYFVDIAVSAGMRALRTGVWTNQRADQAAILGQGVLCQSLRNGSRGYPPCPCVCVAG